MNRELAANVWRVHIHVYPIISVVEGMVTRIWRVLRWKGWQDPSTLRETVPEVTVKGLSIKPVFRLKSQPRHREARSARNPSRHSTCIPASRLESHNACRSPAERSPYLGIKLWSVKWPQMPRHESFLGLNPACQCLIFPYGCWCRWLLVKVNK